MGLARDAIAGIVEAARDPKGVTDKRLASTAPALASLFAFVDGLPPDIRAGFLMRIDTLCEAMDADMAAGLGVLAVEVPDKASSA
jgi:hypothetical protein